MRAHGGGGEFEAFRNLLHRLTARELNKHFKFTRRQFFNGTFVAVQILHGHALGNHRVDETFFLRHQAYGIDQHLGCCALGQITQRARL